MLGQLNETTGQERIYRRMTFDVYMNDAPDRTQAAVTWVAARRVERRAEFKVEANDESGIAAVYVTFSTGVGTWQSLPLAYDWLMQKWMGHMPTQRPIAWFVQVVDGGGNVTTANNKGLYFQLDLPYAMYLPRLER